MWLSTTDRDMQLALQTACACGMQCVQQAMLAATALLAVLASGPLRQHKAPRTALNATQA